jgi:D-alanyl-D-alanine carboxypeptidase (penicillin-binding protein 5/6)
MDAEIGEILFAKEENQRREVASLTKIMTCLVALEYLQSKGRELVKEKILISENASKVPGTTAQLKEGDSLSLF